MEAETAYLVIISKIEPYLSPQKHKNIRNIL